MANDCLNNPVTAVAESQSDANLGQSNGSITILAQGGTPPYEYRINGGDFQTSRIFTGLPAGDHVITVVDSNSCSVDLQVRIVESVGNVPSFSAEILPIIQSRCATSGCHVAGGNAPTVFASHAQISASAAAIKARTQAKTMPPSGSPQLTDGQIQLIADWVDAGAPNN